MNVERPILRGYTDFGNRAALEEERQDVIQSLSGSGLKTKMPEMEIASGKVAGWIGAALSQLREAVQAESINNLQAFGGVEECLIFALDDLDCLGTMISDAEETL